MNLKITKNIKEANLVTHSSTFHPDDVFATMFLSKIVDNPVVCRTNDPSLASDNSLIYDIGFGKFDHHQVDAKYRDNSKIKYCSFGLLWKEYGLDFLEKREIADKELLFDAIDKKLVMQIDAIDNGIFPSIKASYSLLDLDNIIDLFNNAWNENKDNDDNFIEAVKIADIIFERLLIKEQAKIVALKKIEKLIDTVKDNILILDEYMPYQEAIFNSKNPKAEEIKVIILPSNRGGYAIKPKTISPTSKELVCHFSENFNGLHDEELVKVSKIKTARFVHSSGFMACTGTLEDAIKMANNAIKNKN